MQRVFVLGDEITVVFPHEKMRDMGSDDASASFVLLAADEEFGQFVPGER